MILGQVSKDLGWLSQNVPLAYEVCVELKKRIGSKGDAGFKQRENAKPLPSCALS
jgi:hypothetical protein